MPFGPAHERQQALCGGWAARSVRNAPDDAVRGFRFGCRFLALHQQKDLAVDADPGCFIGSRPGRIRQKIVEMPGADNAFLAGKRCGGAKLRRAFSVGIPVDEAIDAEERRRQFFRGTPCFGNQPEMPGFEMKGRELVPDAVVRLFVIRLAGILRHAFKRAGERPRGVREKIDEVILVERIRTWDRRPDVLLENAV